jgi:hypothetical protein
VVVVRRFFRVGDSEFLKFVSGPKRCDEPSRLLAAARPRFRRGRRIMVFWHNFRIFSPRLVGSRLCATRRANMVWQIQLSETLLQFQLFRGDLLKEYLLQLFVQKPEFVEAHTFLIEFCPSRARHCVRQIAF